MIAIQIIKSIQTIHTKKIIHRDIKPENFGLGLGKNSDKIYIFDFGLAKKYMNSEARHIECKKVRSLVGTPRYASINSHIGNE